MRTLTKEQIEARFELQILDPLKEKSKAAGKILTLEQVGMLWFTFLDICYEAKEINSHQHNSWVLSKKYIEMFKS